MSFRPSLRYLVFTLAAMTVASASAQTKPPAPPVRNVTDTHFGTAVPDPYRYFEDLKNPDVAGWMKAEAEYTKAVLRKIPGRDTLLKEVTARGDAAAARVTSVQVVGSKVYYQKRRATDNLFKLYVRDGVRGSERLLVDPEAIKAKADEHYALDYYAPSPDNRYLAYGVSPAGSEESVLHVLDLATGKETGDVIDRANFASPSWLPDGRLRVYPTAEASGRCAGHRQVPEPASLRPQAGRQSRRRHAVVRRRHVAVGRDRPGGISCRLQPGGLLTSWRSPPMACNANSSCGRRR